MHALCHVCCWKNRVIVRRTFTGEENVKVKEETSDRKVLKSKSKSCTLLLFFFLKGTTREILATSDGEGDVLVLNGRIT